MADVTPQRVRQWHERATRTTRPTALAQSYRLLRSLLFVAVADNVIAANPCRLRSAGTPKPARPSRALTVTEVQELAAAVPDRYCALVLAFGGLRFGEATALRRRTRELLGGDGQIQAALTGVHQAIINTTTPRSALNWLRNGAGARLLAGLATGELACTHRALDAHPQARAADYLRHVLVASGALPDRDEALVRLESWVNSTLLTELNNAEHRRLLQAYATWRVLRRLRRRAADTPMARTATTHPRTQLLTARRFLTWLDQQGLALGECRQAHVDDWLSHGPASYPVRDFLTWAGQHRHCPALHVPTLGRTTGAAIDGDQRWTLLARLLHDHDVDLTDRVAGSLLLCYGQQLSHIAVMTTDQIHRHPDSVSVRFGSCDITVPEPLASLLTELIDTGRRYRGVGSPRTPSRWLFPGHLPGRPITPARLGERLRAVGLRALPGRRATLLQLASEVPAAVLADLLHLSPGTATRWTRDAGGDWSRYAASIALAPGHGG